METRYRKGQAKSTTEPDGNGKAWEITTYKNNRGVVACTAREGTLSNENGYACFSYELFGGKQLALAQEEGIATEKRILSVHARGLSEFAKVRATFKPPVVIEMGQVIGKGERQRAVFAIDRPGRYQSVYLNASGYTHDEHLKETDYTEGDKIDASQLADLVEFVEAAEARARRIREEEEEAKRIDRANKTAEGAKILTTIPSWAKAVIIAEERENTSDIQSDYWAHHTLKTVYLAFSTSDRNDFSEMRSAAAKFEATEHLTNAGKEFEHRETWSMGEGYYLGKDKYSGWIVSKESLPKIDVLQIAIAEGRFLCTEGPIEPTGYEGPTGDTVATCTINARQGGIELRFPGKPSEDVLSDLKGNSWRWARGNRCWYKKDSDYARKFASKYAAVPGEKETIDSALVRAEEEAGQDAFAREVQGD
jgi:hypothetical protein